MFELDRTFTIAGRRIGPDDLPYIIAEAGSNFDQDHEKARRLITIAAEAGADAVKFQLFRADVLFPDRGEPHAAFKKLELDPDWIPELVEHAKAQKITFLASAFDPESVKVLEAARVPAHKVASSEATNMRLLDAIAATGKPILLSTGMCDLIDVDEAVRRCLGRGNSAVALMQCGAEYPLPPEHANLRVMDLYRDVYGGPVGFSDHSLGITLSLAAIAREACVIEKHFTYDRTASGPDHSYALEPDELSQLVREAREIHSALGERHKDLLPSEREFGRRDGLYAARDIASGSVISNADLLVQRPAKGLRARYRDTVNEARAARKIKAGAPISWEDIAW